MRILLDNNLSPRLADELRAHGHDVEHVRDHGLGAAPDDQVLGFARVHDRVLVSADTDFGTLLARTGMVKPSVVLIRRSGARRSTELARLLLANLTAVEEDLIDGRDSRRRRQRVACAPVADPAGALSRAQRTHCGVVQARCCLSLAPPAQTAPGLMSWLRGSLSGNKPDEIVARPASP